MMIQSLAPAVEPVRWRAITITSVVAVEAGLIWRYGWSLPLAAYGFLGAALTIAAVIDARTFTIPNLLLWPSYPISLGLFALAAADDSAWWHLERAVIAMVAVAGFYLVVGLSAGGQQMGLADITLGGLLGLLLGWDSWGALCGGVLLGWVLALVVVLAFPRHRSGRRAVVAAGPCLWLGALAVLLATK